MPKRIAGRRGIALLAAALSVSAAVRSSDPIARVRTDVAGFVGMAADGPLGEATPVESWMEFVGRFGDADPALPNPYLAPSVAAFFRNGGRRAHIVRIAGSSEAAYIGDRDPATGRGSGLRALEDVDEVSIVCVPGVASRTVQSAMLALCEGLGDRVAVLDPEPGAGVEAVLAQRAALDSARGFGALYYPWVAVDPADVAGGILPPSGLVAGVWARTDRERGPWEAPVGEIVGALDTSVPVGASESDALGAAGVSPIRSFPGSGVRVWGARTIASDPEWRYVSVRRYLSVLEESIAEGLAWAVFEPNDEPLWASLRASVEEFLLAEWRAGASPAAKPEEAFFVRVDRTTMTQSDLDAKRTVLLAGFAPLRPAEFTILRVVLERSPARRFLRGDANGDGAVDISDPLRALGHLFLGAAEPPCADAADASDEGELTVSSAVRVLLFLFQGGPPPPSPFPACGADPTPDPLGCASSPGC